MSGFYRRSAITVPKTNATCVTSRSSRIYDFGLASLVLCLTIPCQMAGQVVGEKDARTFVEMTPAQLAKEIPELKHLEVAENQELLPQILKGAGAMVAAFFDTFTSTTCTEHVTSMVATALGASDLHFDNKYNYVAMAAPGLMKARLKEYRSDSNGAPVEIKANTGVVTEGFVNQSVHFHPVYQPDSDFRYLGRQNLDGLRTYVVAFAQKPLKARQTAFVNFLDRQGIVYMQGIAWIDPVKYRILRLRTDIEMPDVHVGLTKETTEILYSEVKFQDGAKTLWLPRAVTVSGQLDKYIFHNQHRYSDYRLFNVQVDEKNQKH